MATVFDTLISSQGDDECSSLLNPGDQNRKKRFFSEIRKINSKGAVLSLLLAFLVHCAFISMLKMSTEVNGYFKFDKTHMLASILGLVMFVVSCPVAGWLADVYFGRYKVMRCGIWLMWIGSITLSIVLLLLTQYPDGETYSNYLKISGSVVGFTLLPVGFAAVGVNILQFGRDQMPEASAEEMSAYVKWFTWVLAFSYAIAGLTTLFDVCVRVENAFTSVSVQGLLPLTMLTMAICWKFFFRKWLTVEPEYQNPLKTVYGVLKFAATHKHPLRPGAILYNSDLQDISRFEFAKETYGGPYTIEQVEDVKTFFRIIAVFISTAMSVTPMLLYLISQAAVAFHGERGKSYNSMKFSKTCPEERRWFGLSWAMFVTALIPLYEIVIRPLTRNRIPAPSMLQRVAISTGLMLILSVIIFVVDDIEHASKSTLFCMFNDTANILDPYSVTLETPMNFLVAIQVVLLSSAILEFMCAQSPYTMRGFLAGLLYSLYFLTFVFSYGVFEIWNLNWRHIPDKPSCNFYYFLFQLLCAVGGFIGMCIVAKRYKRRQRGN